MNKQELIIGLHHLANILLPFAQEHASGARVWNGSEYENSGVRSNDPHALMWYAKLNALAAILVAQESDLSPGQIEYLKQTMSGGVGSLADYYVDTRTYGKQGETANKALEKERIRLYGLLC
jgi:hypothetical protein